jgi:hypothetical protein
MTALDPRTHTWAYGEPMLIEDKGIVEHEWTDKNGKKQVVRYSVGVLKPITNETEKA